MSELIARQGIKMSPELRAGFGISSHSEQISTLVASSVGAERGRLERERQELASRSWLGKLAARGRLEELAAAIAAQEAEVEKAMDRARAAKELIANASDPEGIIKSSEEVVGDDADPGQLIDTFLAKIHSQPGSGVLKAYEGGQYLGDCVLCTVSVRDDNRRLIGFQDSKDIVRGVGNDGEPSLWIAPEPLLGMVMSVSVSGAELHGLTKHPELALSQVAAKNVLRLQDFVNPDFDMTPDNVTSPGFM